MIFLSKLQEANSAARQRAPMLTSLRNQRFKFQAEDVLVRTNFNKTVF